MRAYSTTASLALANHNKQMYIATPAAPSMWHSVQGNVHRCLCFSFTLITNLLSYLFGGGPVVCVCVGVEFVASASEVIENWV